MDNRFDVGDILWKRSNHFVFVRIAAVHEEDRVDPEDEHYWYDLETWSSKRMMWINNETVPEGYLKSMYEKPDRLTLLVKFGESDE